MVFLKPLRDLDFSDIDKLKSNQICESDVLDYKNELIEDNKFLKEVCAFANTQGGFLIFGIKETGHGGYPKEVCGIDRKGINSEKLEQLILDNIQPRLEVRFKIIENSDIDTRNKVIVVIEIPRSHLRPHMNGRDRKFYKRYQYEASPMTETEVNDAYKRRFSGYQEINDYIDHLLDAELKREERILRYSKVPKVLGQIIIVPTMLSNLIDTSVKETFDWINPELKLYPDTSDITIDDGDFPHYRMRPSTHGVKSRLNLEGSGLFQEMEIHRNGCISYRGYFQDKIGECEKFFEDARFCVKLMHVFQIACHIHQKNNYFGALKIVVHLSKLKTVDLLLFKKGEHMKKACQTNTIKVVREVSAIAIAAQYELLTSSIMNEIYNSFEEWSCEYFDKNGKAREKELLKNAIFASKRLSQYGYPSYSFGSK